MSREEGSVTIWMLGLSLLLLLFGGVAVDLWRALALQRELAAVADSAAIASASGIDEVHYRATGELLLDPDRAMGLGLAYIDAQDVAIPERTVLVAEDGATVVVTVISELELGLLGVFVGEEEPLTIRTTARAVPVRVP